MGTIFGAPSFETWLWLIAGGFATGLGWATAAWIVGRTLARV